ncbi:MAG: 50S ribosomal protein L28 [Elusimicrobia bacterium]|nr:50S ribosomal protein L28 [Elusimicrobiota bacterium]MBU2614055.1 50S ribosomal protein L28 [Elusimicrobiota bacterium]OGS19287.1 MAG: 50S ribosomal protein L28 [Elusimicrobia bacterium RIFOXYA2_FULL_40_6]
MSYKCVVCDKGPSAGKNVSHSKRATLRLFRPNLQKMRIKFEGSVQRAYVCTKCLKANKVEKVL